MAGKVLGIAAGGGLGITGFQYMQCANDGIGNLQCLARLLDTMGQFLDPDVSPLTPVSSSASSVDASLLQHLTALHTSLLLALRSPPYLSQRSYPTLTLICVSFSLGLGLPYCFRHDLSTLLPASRRQLAAMNDHLVRTLRGLRAYTGLGFGRLSQQVARVDDHLENVHISVHNMHQDVGQLRVEMDRQRAQLNGATHVLRLLSRAVVEMGMRSGLLSVGTAGRMRLVLADGGGEPGTHERDTLPSPGARVAGDGHDTLRSPGATTSTIAVNPPTPLPTPLADQTNQVHSRPRSPFASPFTVEKTSTTSPSSSGAQPSGGHGSTTTLYTPQRSSSPTLFDETSTSRPTFTTTANQHHHDTSRRSRRSPLLSSWLGSWGDGWSIEAHGDAPCVSMEERTPDGMTSTDVGEPDRSLSPWGDYYSPSWDVENHTPPPLPSSPKTYQPSRGLGGW